MTEQRDRDELSTDRVRMDYAYLGGYSREAEYDSRSGAFDRWLAGKVTQAKAEALRDFADTLGVNVGDEDDEYWRGYRNGQRQALRMVTESADRIESEAAVTEMAQLGQDIEAGR